MVIGLWEDQPRWDCFHDELEQNAAVLARDISRWFNEKAPGLLRAPDRWLDGWDWGRVLVE
jgi:hypothetical protein